MRIMELSLLAIIIASPLMAQEHRELGAHEHGVGQLDVAFQDNRVEMKLHAPGADIVGFEYLARSAEDRAAVENALAALARPVDLFALPKAAECSVTDARAKIAPQNDEGHVDQVGHGDKHAEFMAEYALTCANINAIDRINFQYFNMFPNARELNVQMLSGNGARGLRIERNAPLLDLRGLM